MLGLSSLFVHELSPNVQPIIKVPAVIQTRLYPFFLYSASCTAESERNIFFLSLDSGSVYCTIMFGFGRLREIYRASQHHFWYPNKAASIPIVLGFGD